MLLWVLTNPFLAMGSFLLVEACLPVFLQPSAWVLRGLIRSYQVVLSSAVPTQCKFTPTCSHYGLGAIRKYGTLRGGILTTWRLLRCSPFTDGGHDPLP